MELLYVALFVLFIILLDYTAKRRILKNFKSFKQKYNFQESSEDVYNFLKNYYLPYAEVRNRRNLLSKIMYGVYREIPLTVFFFSEGEGRSSKAYTIFSYENTFNDFELSITRKSYVMDMYMPSMRQYRKIRNKLIHKRYIIKSNDHELVEYLLTHNTGSMLAEKKIKQVNAQILNDQQVLIYYKGIVDKKFCYFLDTACRLYLSLQQDIEDYQSQKQKHQA